MRRRANERSCQLLIMRDALPNCRCQRKACSCACNQLFCRAACTPSRNSNDSFSSGDIQPANANPKPSRTACMPSSTRSMCIDLTRIRGTFVNLIRVRSYSVTSAGGTLATTRHSTLRIHRDEVANAARRIPFVSCRSSWR
jgi:hypothetical protein